mgnify:CR=1 FL=1
MAEIIEAGSVVGFSYKLTTSEGKLIDQSNDQHPFEYLHGYANIVPGLEKEVTGMKVGETKLVKVQPEEGYGVHSPNLLFEIPKTNFPQEMDLQVGMEFESHGEEGTMVIVIKEVKADTVMADANHPLAGVELHFDIKINTIRKATEQELAHGHVHAHGHDH